MPKCGEQCGLEVRYTCVMSDGNKTNHKSQKQKIKALLIHYVLHMKIRFHLHSTFNTHRTYIYIYIYIYINRVFHDLWTLLQEVIS